MLTFFSPVAPAGAMTTETPPSAEAVAAPTVSIVGEPLTREYLRAVDTIDRTKQWERITYKWLLDGQPIVDDWSEDKYGVRPADFGHRISVRITLEEWGADPVTIISDETKPVIGSVTGHLLYPDDLILGKTVTANASVYGYPDFTSEPDRAFTWSRNGTPIPGATSASYTVTEADMGAEITATVVVSSPGYQALTLSSSFGVGFRGYLALAGAPVITWTGPSTYWASPGTVLRASKPPVVGTAPAGLGYTYQWFERTHREQAIPGATGETYVPTAESIGNQIGVWVSPTAPNYQSKGKGTGFNDKPYIQGSFTGLRVPSIKGTAMPGQVLTAVPGTAPTPVADTVQYEWYRGTARLTSWDTDPTYRLTPADGGFRITVRTRYIRTNYQIATTALSAPVTPPGYLTIPQSARIRGTAAVGYTVTAETWSDLVSPKPTKSSYQWLRDGKPITGATGLSYRLTAADQWRQITFRETYTRAGYSNGVWTSPAVKPVALFTRLANPVVTGTTKVGYTLRATVATPSPAPTSTSWQWLRDGKAIPGATSAAYKLTRADRNAHIRVKVTFRKSAYLNTARHSASRWLA